MWKTQDGGRIWSLQQEWQRAYVDSLGAILDIYFVDDTRGWAVGFNGLNALILGTKDGGRGWSVQYSGSEITAQFRQVRFTDALLGWVLSHDAVMQTEDGGETWKLRYFDKGTLNCIDPISQTEVWLAGGWGYLLHTRNGVKWSEIQLGGQAAANYWGYVKLTPEGRGWAWGPKCNFAVTRDFGKTWTEEACPLKPELSSDIALEGMALTNSTMFMIANPKYLLVRPIKN
jgi:photosystem II stability/assembly factor-like uncharacterized protein